MRHRLRHEDRLRRRADGMPAPVASLTSNIGPWTRTPTSLRSNDSGPSWRPRSTSWPSARASCAPSPLAPPLPRRSRPTRSGRPTWFGQRTAAWLPVRWLSHCEWHPRPAGVTPTSVEGGSPVAPPANVIHVSRAPTWPGAAPGPALRSPMRPGPAWTVCPELAQPMLLGFRQDASSFGPKLRMHVRRPHGSKPLSNLQRIFLVKNSEIWQGFLRAR